MVEQLLHAPLHQDFSSELARTWSHIYDFIGSADRLFVVFDDDHQQKVVELKMWLPRGQTCVATGEAADFRSALDRAADRLRVQLAKGGSHATRRSTAT